MTLHVSSLSLNRRLPLIVALVAVAVFAGVEIMAPDPLELPLISLLTLGIATAIAFIAWLVRAPRNGERVTAWDVAGAFTLIGCAAAMLTQNEQALEHFLAAERK